MSRRKNLWAYALLGLVCVAAFLPALVRFRETAPAAPQESRAQMVVPDVAIRHVVGPQLDSIDTRNTGWVGEGRVKSEKSAPPVLSIVAAPGASELYEVRVKNVGQGTGTATITLSRAATGWTAGFVDVDENGTTPLKPSTVWTTPGLAPGQEAKVQLQVTNKETITPLSLSIMGQTKGGSDRVSLAEKVQHIARIEWSLDNKNWSPVTSTSVVQVTRFASLGMRAIGAFPGFAWGDNSVLGPKWSFQNSTVEGDSVSLGPSASTLVGAPVTAILGNTQSLLVKVLPDARVTINADSGMAWVSPGEKECHPINVTVTVMDESHKLLPKTRVRLRSARGNNPVFSQWQVPGDRAVQQSKEIVLATDEKGEIHIVWWIAASAAQWGGKVTITGIPVDASTHPFGEDDNFSFTMAEADAN